MLFSDSFFVGNATFKVLSAPSHCRKVQLSMWNVTVFARSSTVYDLALHLSFHLPS